MKLRIDNWYKSDKGKYFILTEKGKQECANYKHQTIGKPIQGYETEVSKYDIDNGYFAEVDIPGWTRLMGFQVVYYLDNGHRMIAGNPHVFPMYNLAETYKKHYEAYPWFNHELFIENVEYEGIPLSESKKYNGKIVVDKEHYFGLDAHEVGEYFAEDMINYFMGLLPPACMRSDCCQIGEPTTSKADENGKYRNTYPTFKRITEDIWEYCGDCFRGENVQRGEDMPCIM